MNLTFRFTVLALLVAAPILCSAQRKHVYVDTIKTTQVRVDYSPDTIPVYFKELVIMRGKVYDIYNTTSDKGVKTSKPRDTTEVTEKWQEGFVVWQTYEKSNFDGWSSMPGSYSVGTSTAPAYYTNPYEPSRLADGKFLYIDKKPVTNKVIFSIKR